jgi:hypothetical protein
MPMGTVVCHWIDGAGEGGLAGVYPVFSALNRGDGHEPAGSVSNPDPLVVSTVWDGFGVSVSGHDDEHPLILTAAPAVTTPKKSRRDMEGIGYTFQ